MTSNLMAAKLTKIFSVNPIRRETLEVYVTFFDQIYVSKLHMYTSMFLEAFNYHVKLLQ